MVTFAEIPEKPFLLPIVKGQHQHDDVSNTTAFCALLCNRDLPHLKTQHSMCIFPTLVLQYMCASLESLVEVTRLPGLSCQDLTCLPEDKAITGCGVGDVGFLKTHYSYLPVLAFSVCLTVSVL